MMKKMILVCLASVWLGVAGFGGAAVAQTNKPIYGTGDYVASVAQPAYKKGTGPRVLIDEAHNNYQTMDDRFKGFADLLIADGARVRPSRVALTAAALADADILVICNALSLKNATEKKTIDKWMLPAPDAFTDDEVKAVSDWVKGGGALLLIADHMPFPAAADKLGAAMGVVMSDNFAFDAAFTYKPGDMNLIKFYQQPPSPSVGKLRPHPVVQGRKESERIPYVVTFTGNGFRMKPGVEFSPIMELGEGAMIAWPTDHADISVKTPFTAGAGLYQGVVLPVGYGRAGVFGEASMFSVNYAEWAKYYPTGYQNPDAPYNKQFILNLVHWLAKDEK